jgi:hypothetical protein
MGMGPSRQALALCALLGIGLITAGCSTSPTASPTPASTVTTPGSAASSPATAPASPASSASTAPGTQALPGVVAECTSRPPYRLSTQPTEIVLACADAGIGVENMTWTGWESSAATGHGSLWENLCQPNCAEGTIATYPVTVTLSVVKASSQGPWFSRLTVAWQGSRPPNATPDSFGLLGPSS